jgi:transcriptional regulator with XRE-family HTH domain
VDDFSTRLKELLDFLDITPVTLAEKMGVQRTSFNHLLSGRNKPGFEFLAKLHSCYPTLNLNWVVSGEGPLTIPGDLTVSSAEKKEQEIPISKDTFSNIFNTPVHENNTTLHSKPVEITDQGQGRLLSSLPQDQEIDRLIIVYKNGKMVEVKQ